MTQLFLDLEEYKGYRAIYPPTEGTIINGCCSCLKNVRTDCGFVKDKSYFCTSCIKIAIGGNKASELLMYAQEKYRKSK